MIRELLFWGAAALLVLAAGAAITSAFVSRRSVTAGAAEPASLAALREQAETLLQEREEGLISEEEYAAERGDLERRVAEEVKGTGPARTQPAKWAAPACICIAAAGTLGLYTLLGSAPNIALFDSEPDRTMGTALGEAPEFSLPSLKSYLERVKNDERAWVLYARMLVREGSWAEASAAYSSALALKGLVAGDPEIWLEYAASSLSTGTAESKREAHRAARQAVFMNETDQRARQILAIASMETGQWSDARESLEYLLGRLSREDASWENISKAAAYAAAMEKRQGGGTGSEDSGSAAR